MPLILIAFITLLAHVLGYGWEVGALVGLGIVIAATLIPDDRYHL